eukprot:137072-Rhodomonas_salina.1
MMSSSDEDVRTSARRSIFLRASYAMPGTDAYAAHRQRAAIAKRVRRVSLSPVGSPICLRARYAMSARGWQDEERKLSLKHDAPSSDSESDFR